MTDATPADLRRNRPARPRVLIALAWAVLLWERLWRGLWAPAAVIGAYLAAALFGLPQSLPGSAHLALLAVTGLAALVAGWFGMRGFSAPGSLDAQRRLERDSGLPHRPLNVLDDSAAGDDPLAVALWRLHQERVRASLGHMRVGLPRPAVLERDPFALRILVLLVLLLAATGSWGEWQRRVSGAFSPHFTAIAPPPPPMLDAWLAPPEYTGLPPIFLVTAGKPMVAGGESAKPVAVPRGSVLMARLTGGKEVPRAEADGVSLTFETVEPGTYQLQRKIETGPRLAVLRQGEVLAQWPIAIVPDLPPTVAFSEDPVPGANGALKIAVAASDDYGLTALGLTVRRDGEGAPKEALEVPLPLPGSRPKEVTQTSVQDLTPHPWAGLPVVLTLTATDGAGQTTRGAEVRMLLPERHFKNPVAKAIIDVRKELVRVGADGRVPAASRLLEIGSRPDAFGYDTVAVLALRSAAGRLLLDQGADAVTEVVPLMWDTALRIEDGSLSIAERDLRDAQDHLRDALDRNAGDEEVARLMDDLQQAIDQYMNAMEQQLKQALDRGETVPEIPPELADRMNAADPGDLQSMMDRMRALAETGSRDAAREMLSQLQQMMENMRLGTVNQDQRGKQDETWKQLRDLKDLAARQQQLLDEAFQASQSADMGRARDRSASPTMQAQAEQQERLRRDLADMMRKLGESGVEPPPGLARAERAMRNAVQALRRGQPGNAVPRQTQAVDELQQGVRSFAENAMQRMMEMGGMPGMPSPGGMRAPGKGRDPLGRRASGNGPIDSGDVRIPEEADLQKAREILDELRRRSGEYSRPRNERDYIDRLLRQF